MLEWRKSWHLLVLNIIFLWSEVTQKSCSCCSWNALTALAEVCFVSTMEPILCWCKGHVEGFNLGQDLSLLLLSGSSIFMILLTLLLFLNCSKLAHAVNFTLNVHFYPLKRPWRCFVLKLLRWAYNNRADFLRCVFSFDGVFCFSKFSNELVHRVECCLHLPFDLVLNHFPRWICFNLRVFLAS